ncbi:MAG TPA: DegQ family serine endoprotease [Gammaproteobacteria bacterium]
MTNTRNWRSIIAPIPVMLALLLMSFQASGGIPVSDGMPTLAPIIDRAEPAVVNISTRGHVEMQQHPFFNDPFFQRFFDMPNQPRQRETTSLGSGVIINAEEGLIVTNNHVIDNADEVTVTLYDNREFSAEILGTDPRTDLALLKIDADDLVELSLADSERVQVGDFVIAIGNPFGLAHTVTSGIVSAKGRGNLNAENYENFIQTDASINPGNSGGALIDLQGRLVGINTAILSRSGGNIGIGFAIPSNMLEAVVSQLLEYGEVKRGVLGVHVQNVTGDLAQAFGLEEDDGALVASVLPESSADKAGIEAGDVIVAINGEPIEDMSDLRNAIGLLRVGEELDIELVRDGERLVVTTEIGEPEVSTAAAVHPALEGATFTEIDEESPLYEEVQGVMVGSVQRGSPASRAGGIGLRPGDVITSVNRQPVESVEEFREIVSNTQGVLLFKLRRGDNSIFLAVQ